MERGSSSGGSSFVVGYGENSCSTGRGLCSTGTVMMAPPMNNCGAEMDHKLFFPFVWNNSANSSNGGQRVSALFPQDRNQGVSSVMEVNNADCQNNRSNGCFLRAKILGHPLFSKLLNSYVNCQKVGAPPEVLAGLEEVCASYNAATAGGDGRSSETAGYVGEDPALDQFMEAYCEMLAKYEQELTKPFKEAMLFFSRIESQLKALEVSSISSVSEGENSLAMQADTYCDCRFGNSKEKEVHVEDNYIDPESEDKDLKLQLLRKYSGYLGSLKQEFLKKKKNGKLPKEARQKLLDWWTKHYKWPYPSEGQKVALADSTGLDLKQINNWFINQRKRHWRPSDDMQFVVMDADHPAHFYMDSIISNPFALDCPSSLL